MSPSSDSPVRRRLIDAEAKAAFLATLSAGAPREEAAAAGGFPIKSFYNARKRDPLFTLAWGWAQALSPAARRRATAAAPLEPPAGEVRIAPQGNRPLQRRRMGWVRFTEERQQAFLDHFAATADARAAAAAAGISYATVRSHYRKHPEFAAGWDEALGQAVAELEAEIVRRRVAAQRRLSEAIAAGKSGDATDSAGSDTAAEFERVMKLLARWDRRGGRGGAGLSASAPSPARAWTFEQAIVALDKRLRALGLRTDAAALEGPPDGSAP